MIIFRLGRRLLVGVQVLLIFKENKITAHHPLSTREKTQTPKKAKLHKEMPPNTATLLQGKYIQLYKWYIYNLYSNLCFDTK